MLIVLDKKKILTSQYTVSCSLSPALAAASWDVPAPSSVDPDTLKPDTSSASLDRSLSASTCWTSSTSRLHQSSRHCCCFLTAGLKHTKDFPVDKALYSVFLWSITAVPLFLKDVVQREHQTRKDTSSWEKVPECMWCSLSPKDTSLIWTKSFGRMGVPIRGRLLCHHIHMLLLGMFIDIQS